MHLGLLGGFYYATEEHVYSQFIKKHENHQSWRYKVFTGQILDSVFLHFYCF